MAVIWGPGARGSKGPKGPALAVGQGGPAFRGAQLPVPDLDPVVDAYTVALALQALDDDAFQQDLDALADRLERHGPACMTWGARDLARQLLRES